MNFFKRIGYQFYLDGFKKHIYDQLGNYNKEELSYFVISNHLASSVFIRNVLKKDVDIIELYNDPLKDKETSSFLYHLYRKSQQNLYVSQNSLKKCGIETSESDVNIHYLADGLLAALFGIVHSYSSLDKLYEIFHLAISGIHKDDFLALTATVQAGMEIINPWDMMQTQLTLHPKSSLREASDFVSDFLSTPTTIIEIIENNKIAVPCIPKILLP